jgi:hypothetical protein
MTVPELLTNAVADEADSGAPNHLSIAAMFEVQRASEI